MMQILKEQKIGIISGIASSAIFLYFIQPILNFLAHLFVIGSNFVGSAYTDRIYQQVAHLETQDFSFILFVLFFGAQAALFISFGIMGLNHSIFGNKTDKKNQISQDESTTSKSISVRLILSSVFILMGFFLTVVMVSDFIQLSTISSFKQHIRIISPYITDQEEEELISQWSLIQSKSDYQKIYAKINEIAKSREIDLPENKIYSLLSI